MNKCLSLVHLTSRIGSQSSGSDESTSWFLRCPKPDLDPPGTKSVSGRLTLIAAAPCSALRLNFRAGNHLPRTPQLRLPTSPFLGNSLTSGIAHARFEVFRHDARVADNRRGGRPRRYQAGVTSRGLTQVRDELTGGDLEPGIPRIS